jgi:lysophospholipase L1-like esterase
MGYSSYTRRAFTGMGLTGVVAAAAAAVQGSEGEEASHGSLVNSGDVVLFQGDSITDAHRKRDAAAPNDQPALGGGYAWLAASQLLVDRPGEELQVFNRGISGNKVPDLAARWQGDCLDLKPSVLSILVGVNDLWHKLDGKYEGDFRTYEEGLGQLIDVTRDALPGVKLVICEPFVLRCGAVDEKWFPDFDEYRAAAKRTAERAGARFVPFQTMFDAASRIAPPERWAADGVHPTPDGAALMAHAWRRIVDG